MMGQDIRICFLGDSLVHGTKDEKALGWAGRLCASAIAQGFPITYYNLGIRGDTSEGIKQRWEHECALRLGDDCDSRLVLSCGVNDTAIKNGSQRVPFEDSRSNVREILTQAKQKYQLLMVSPPPVVDEAHNERIKALSQAFADESQLVGIPYIDVFFPLFKDKVHLREVSKNDGAHPKQGGYGKMAEIVKASPHWWF